MIVEQQIEIANTILAAGVGVLKVYHSCEFVRDDKRGIVGPAYRLGDEFKYVGLGDMEGFYGYIRYNGDVIATPERVGSCAGYTSLVTPLRVVLFNDNEKRDHALLQLQLTRLAFQRNVSLTRIVLDKFSLVKQESDQIRASFGASTFYLAYDLLVNTVVLPSNCEQDLCRKFDNPIKCIQ